MTRDVVASLTGVSHRYGATAALSDLSLDIPSGCMAGLIGPDGVIREIWRKVRVKGHVEAVLEACLRRARARLMRSHCVHSVQACARCARAAFAAHCLHGGSVRRVMCRLLRFHLSSERHLDCGCEICL